MSKKSVGRKERSLWERSILEQVKERSDALTESVVTLASVSNLLLKLQKAASADLKLINPNPIRAKIAAQNIVIEKSFLCFC